jgi:hypothetical protein
MVAWLMVGLMAGFLAGLDWKTAWAWVGRNEPWSTAVLGAILAAVAYGAWRLAAFLPFTARITGLKIKIPGVTDVEVTLSVGERTVLWRFFVELCSRVASRGLDREGGLLREAMKSLHGLFAIARTDLASLPPGAEPPKGLGRDGRAPVQSYVLGILNDHLRPFLTRWHPRLAAWEGFGLPEAAWPLAPLCRVDLEHTRQRILWEAWRLGRELRIAKLDRLLPDAPSLPPELLPDERIAEAERELAARLPPQRAQAGWRIFVEAATRISIQPLAPDTGLLREAMTSLHSLFNTARTELKALPPPMAAGGLEEVTLDLINGTLRPFLAKWHPRLKRWESENPGKPEGDWPEATQCRAELDILRRDADGVLRRLAKLVGMENPDTLLPSSPITFPVAFPVAFPVDRQD